jgi:hypothetical protein
MPLDQAHEQRQLPNKASGLRGIRTWFFGRREYAHPALRWASTPLFRLAWIPFVINVSQNYHDTILFILFATLCGISVVADSINFLLLRRRRTSL